VLDLSKCGLVDWDGHDECEDLDVRVKLSVPKSVVSPWSLYRLGSLI
jgi:hypothetical protein